MKAVDGTHVALASKVPYQKAKRGDRLIAFGPSGGGYGDPLRRDPAAVLDNVLDGLFSLDVAREQHGVVINQGTVDAAATLELRKARRT